jgi:hypothetical protein
MRVDSPARPSLKAERRRAQQGPTSVVGTVTIATELGHRYRKRWIGRLNRNPTRGLKPDQITELIERGAEFVGVGDLNSARLLFERAAEARDPKAAFALAATYDPIVLAVC